MEKNNYLEAVQLLRTENHGILSTLSKKFNGYPFGSFTTFTSDRSRTIMLYMSDIAQHTINLKKDPRACFTVFKLVEKGDQQNSKRLSLMGDLKKIEETDSMIKRFRMFLPHSIKYSKIHGFNFYKLSIKQVRWIRGFGEIAWLNPKNWMDINPKWQAREQYIIQHMNDDHINSIISALHAQHNIRDKSTRMVALNIDGYYVETDQKLKFISFENHCLDLKQYKDELVRQAQQYREFEL